jgi:hypothetical protein
MPLGSDAREQPNMWGDVLAVRGGRRHERLDSIATKSTPIAPVRLEPARLGGELDPHPA